MLMNPKETAPGMKNLGLFLLAVGASRGGKRSVYPFTRSAIFRNPSLTQLATPYRPLRSLTVVIPCREGAIPSTTLASLARQTYQNFDIIVVHDRGRGANWARNCGFRLVRTEFVLFSDDDIDWHPTALQALKSALDAHPEASYSYGTYSIPGVGLRSGVPFDAMRL